MSRGRQALQVAQAPSAHPVQHDPGAVSRQMGAAGRLSDGGAELRGGALSARQEDGPRPAGAEAEVASKAFPVHVRTARQARSSTRLTPAPRVHRCGCDRPSSAARWSAAASDGRGSRIRRT
ncbi:hypothetical protein NS44R_14920, partial [Mammaliicoccus sciuri]